MEYLVKSNTRWENGSFLCVMSFDSIVSQFMDVCGCDDVDEEIDAMLFKIAHLEVGECYNHVFFIDDEYYFKRIRWWTYLKSSTM